MLLLLAVAHASPAAVAAAVGPVLLLLLLQVFAAAVAAAVARVGPVSTGATAAMRWLLCEDDPDEEERYPSLEDVEALCAWSASRVAAEKAAQEEEARVTGEASAQEGGARARRRKRRCGPGPSAGDSGVADDKAAQEEEARVAGEASAQGEGADGWRWRPKRGSVLGWSARPSLVGGDSLFTFTSVPLLACSL